jgi:hypothetical protein
MRGDSENVGMKVAHGHFLNELGRTALRRTRTEGNSPPKPEKITSVARGNQCKTLEKVSCGKPLARNKSAIAGGANPA